MIVYFDDDSARRRLFSTHEEVDAWSPSANVKSILADELVPNAIVVGQCRARGDFIGSLRSHGFTGPVVAMGGNIADLLRAGADVVMSGSASPEDMLEQVDALTRCKNRIDTPNIEIGDLSYDSVLGQFKVNGETLPLSGLRSEIMRMLVSAAGRPVSKRDLIRSAWGADAVDDSKLYWVVNRLRTLLTEYGLDGKKYLSSERIGTGEVAYCLRAPS